MDLPPSRRDFMVSLGASIAASGALLPLASRGLGQAAKRAAPPIRATRLGDHLIALLGDGGNMALVTGGDGLLLIDSGYLEQADDLRRAIAAQDPGPVKTVFNTHWHVDHVGANPALGRAGAAIVAHSNVKLRLSQTITVAAMGNRVFQPLPPEGLPSRTFEDDGKFETGAGAAEYAHFPTAHTDGDSYVFFPELNILHTGDLFWNGIYPLIDYSTLGWIGGMAASNVKLLGLCDAKTVVIPGHGAIADRSSLERSREMLATVQGRLEALIKAGKTVEEAVAASPTGEFDAAWRGMKPEAFVRMSYTGIVRRAA